MKKIEEYIEESKNLPNISDGGSECYSFGDVVLVKYKISSKYGKARPTAEFVAKEANKKNEKGVNTPKHLGIYREIVGDTDICWVLQEKVKGVCFTNYSYNKNFDYQLKMQKILADAPIKHYEKLIRDLCELSHLGLELKPKNVFYDNDLVNGGFYFIDLLGNYGEKFDGSLKSILYVNNLARFVSWYSRISSYNDKAMLHQIDTSHKQVLQIDKKLFVAMQKTIPNFDKYKRWILRNLDKEQLDGFIQTGIIIPDLTLTNNEKSEFNDYIKKIIDNSIDDIKTGKTDYWNICVNDIRIALDNWGLAKSWPYHSGCNLQRHNFEDNYDFDYATSKQLENLVLKKFEECLDKEAKTDRNPNIQKAYIEMIDAKQKSKV